MRARGPLRKETKCLRCGADSSWIELAGRVRASRTRERANARRRLLKLWRALYATKGNDSSRGSMSDRFLDTVGAAYEALGGRRLR